MAFIESKALRPQLVKVYREWVKHNLWFYSFIFNACTLMSVSVLIPFDFLLFGDDWKRFLLGRMMSVCGNGVSLLGLAISLRVREGRVKQKLVTFSALFSPLVWTFVYFGFLNLELTESARAIVVGGNYLLILTCTFLLHRFAYHQYAFNFISVLGVVFLSAIGALEEREAYQLLLAQLLFPFFMIVLRREFISNLFERYKSLCVMVPEKLARFLIVQRQGILEAEVFLPKKRNLVCLVSDWRDFQAKAEVSSSEEMAIACSAYYTMVFDLLKTTSKSGNFFADWTADELVVIFYEDSEVSFDQVKKEAIQFAIQLGTAAFEGSRTMFQGQLYFDIGLAAGSDLIGLLGPDGKKKLTVVGKTPGRAKRLEGEGKKVRRSMDTGNVPPIVVMEEDVADFAVKNGLMEMKNMETWRATEKNIDGKVVKLYCDSEVIAQIKEDSGTQIKAS